MSCIGLDRFWRLPLALVIAIGITAASDAQAAHDIGQIMRVGEKFIDKDKAASIARTSAGGGRVLGVRTQAESQHPVFEVKVLSTEGRVRVLRVDGDSGSVLP
jgi:uncharacterized membrane protein YkoI